MSFAPPGHPRLLFPLLRSTLGAGANTLAISSSVSEIMWSALRVELAKVLLCVIPMEVDTGSPITLIPEEIWTKTLNLPLQPSDLKLISYTKNPLNLRGKCEVNVGLNGQKMLHVARKGGATLMGRDWLRKIRLNWDELKIHHLSSPISTLIDRYGSLFSEEQGELKGFTAHLALKEGAQPSYIPAREIPYAMREKVEADLDRLVKRGVIYKVKHSRWSSPIVVVPKPDNAIRVCGDYKPTDPEVKQYFSSRRDLTIEGAPLYEDLESSYQQNSAPSC